MVVELKTKRRILPGGESDREGEEEVAIQEKELHVLHGYEIRIANGLNAEETSLTKGEAEVVTRTMVISIDPPT